MIKSRKKCQLAFYNIYLIVMNNIKMIMNNTLNITNYYVLNQFNKTK